MHGSNFKSRQYLYVLLCVSHFLSAVDSTKYVTRPGTKLQSQYVMDTRNVSSAIACVATCTSETVCQSASWRSRDRQCVLSDVDVALVWSLVTGNAALEDDAEWTTYGEIFYPVAIYIGEYHYSLTFADAKQLCQDQGTELATRAQVLAARAIGLHMCACAWFADETNGFVLQYFIPACWYTYNTGILTCGHALADAWCVMK